MRTTLILDDEALEAAMKLSEGRTKSEVLNEALRRFVRNEAAVSFSISAARSSG